MSENLWQTDGQKVRHIATEYRASVASRGKNMSKLHEYMSPMAMSRFSFDNNVM